MYLVLPAGTNRSQTINFIKENNGWPHQVSLIKSIRKMIVKPNIKKNNGYQKKEKEKKRLTTWVQFAYIQEVNFLKKVKNNTTILDYDRQHTRNNISENTLPAANDQFFCLHREVNSGQVTKGHGCKDRKISFDLTGALHMWLTWSKSRRSWRSDSPTHLLRQSAPFLMKKETFLSPWLHSLARARATRVFPVPGGP